MRPDIEDFEELSAALEDTPRSRAMSWLVLALAVGGFSALAYYAYHSGAESMQNGDVLVVEADSTPMKETPAEPGGEQFANQEKTIYDAISSSNSADAAEKLLPEPEKPVAVPQAVVVEKPAAPEPVAQAAAPAPTTFVKNPEPAPQPVAAAPVAEKPAPLVVPTPSAVVAKKAEAVAPVVKEVKEVKKEVAKPVVAAAAKPKATVAAVTKPAAAPETRVEQVATAEVKPAVVEANDPEAGEPNFINESPVAEAKPAASKPAVKEDEPKAAPKAEAKASSGSYQVQLGAFKSEDEANAHWKKVSAKFGSVLTGGSSVVKAELPNGTFYRLRASGFSSADAAKSACTKLSAGGQACFPVK